MKTFFWRSSFSERFIATLRPFPYFLSTFQISGEDPYFSDCPEGIRRKIRSDRVTSLTQDIITKVLYFPPVSEKLVIRYGTSL